MYDDMLSKIFANPQAMPTVLSSANQLMVSNVEKLTTFQMNALQSYVDLGLKQCKAAAQVTDAQGLQAFYQAQADTVNVIRQRLMEDAQALADMGADFKKGMEVLVKDCVAGAGMPGFKVAA